VVPKERDVLFSIKNPAAHSSAGKERVSSGRGAFPSTEGKHSYRKFFPRTGREKTRSTVGRGVLRYLENT